MACDTTSSEYFSHYRISSVGVALIDTLDDLICQNRISAELANKVCFTFDKVIAETLTSQVTSQMDCKAHVIWYRHCDEVYTWMVDNLRFTSKEHRLTTDIFTTDRRVWIVACKARIGA